MCFFAVTGGTITVIITVTACTEITVVPEESPAKNDCKQPHQAENEQFNCIEGACACYIKNIPSVLDENISLIYILIKASTAEGRWRNPV